MMEKQERVVLYAKSMERWGHFSQIDRCIEVLSELIQSLCKAKRYDRPKDWLSSVFEEIADVTIMLEEMAILYEGEEVIPQYIEDKLLRREVLVEARDKEEIAR